MIYDEDETLLINTLKSYVLPKDFDLHDWGTIISRKEQYKDDVFIYKLAYADLYLTEDLEYYDVEPKVG